VAGVYAFASRRSEAVSLQVVNPITISLGMDVSAPKSPFDCCQRPEL